MSSERAARSGPRQGARTPLTAVAGGVGAAVAVWLIARYGAGMHLRTPGFAPAQHPSDLGVGLVVAASAVAGVAAWGATRLIARTARHPRRVWITVGLLVMAVSLAAPLVGHGITAANRLTLICMHLAVAAVLIPAFALTLHRGEGSAGAPATPDSVPAAPGRYPPSLTASR